MRRPSPEAIAREDCANLFLRASVSTFSFPGELHERNGVKDLDNGVTPQANKESVERYFYKDVFLAP